MNALINQIEAESGKKISVEDANGNTMTMNSSGTKVEDANGNVIEMAAAGITAEAPKIVLKGGQVHLGDEGGEPVIKGQSFLSMFMTHMHTCTAPGSPTSPPTRGTSGSRSPCTTSARVRPSPRRTSASERVNAGL